MFPKTQKEYWKERIGLAIISIILQVLTIFLVLLR